MNFKHFDFIEWFDLNPNLVLSIKAFLVEFLMCLQFLFMALQKN